MQRSRLSLLKISASRGAYYHKLASSYIEPTVTGLAGIVEDRGRGSATEIAAQLGCSRSFLHDVIHGRRSLSPSMLRKIAELK